MTDADQGGSAYGPSRRLRSKRPAPVAAPAAAGNLSPPASYTSGMLVRNWFGHAWRPTVGEIATSGFEIAVVCAPHVTAAAVAFSRLSCAPT